MNPLRRPRRPLAPAAFAQAFPAYAALDAAGLLELVEETNCALALSSRGAHEAAEALIATAAVRLGLTADFDRLADYLLTLSTEEHTR